MGSYECKIEFINNNFSLFSQFVYRPIFIEFGFLKSYSGNPTNFNLFILYLENILVF